MKTKHIILLILFLTGFVSFSNAADKKADSIEIVKNNGIETRFIEIRNRINEIRKLDKSKLDKVERENLLKEKNNLKKELKSMRRESDSTLWIYLGILFAVFLVTIIVI